jgi:HK97 family phage major capsid protein
LGTVGDIILVDLSQYLLIDKGGIQTAASIHVRFVFDESCLRVILRVDGQPIWNSALTPYKGSNTLSPYVALATRG